MNILNLSCCGLQEINGVGSYRSPAEALRGFIMDSRPVGVRSGVIFTSASTRKGEPATYAVRLKDYIEDNNLGTVTALPSFRNKNSGNYVTPYLWVVKPMNLRKWYRAQ